MNDLRPSMLRGKFVKHEPQHPPGPGCGRSDAVDPAAYLAGELSEAEHAHGQAHLAGCADCRAAVASCRAVLDRLAGLPRAQVARDLAPAVLARLDAPAPLRLPVSFWTGLARAAALVALLAGGGLLYGHFVMAPSVSAAPATRAADWLCRTQEPDGSWSTARWGGSRRYEPALTALSLLALLDDRAGAGPLTRSAADRAIRHLCERQNTAGGFGDPFDGAPYNDGMATLALLRAYRDRPGEPLKAVLDRAVAQVIARQLPDGGWGYVGQATPAANLSITVWQVEALRVASVLGWREARGPAARGVRWIAAVGDEEGSFGYRQTRDFPEGTRTLTAMGAMSLFDAGEGNLVPAARRTAIQARLRRMAVTERPDLDYYGGYMLAAALRRMDEEAGRLPLETLRNALAARQVNRGPERGSWNADDRWGGAGGRVYATAMASLSLQ